MTERMDDARFVERVAATLREPEVLDAEFERRVMAAVRQEGLPWWRRPRTVAVSPLGGLALAAGMAGLVVLGAFAGARTLTPSVARPAVVVAADTVHLVRFVLAAPGASQVTLVGDFNGWARESTPLQRTAEDEVWSVSIPLAPGRHEYAFVIDGDRWVTDPFALRHVDDFGTESSVLRLGRAAVPGA